jgi:peptidoglycan/xylan/chitin deacetylase (PgdA/CDA1 family)
MASTKSFLVGGVAALLLPMLAGAAQTVSLSQSRSVVLTFDDIPLGQGQPGTRCNGDALRAVNEPITRALLEIRAPSAAFITTGNVCDRLRPVVLRDILRLWKQAGAVIGNHGHRHLSLSRVPLEEYTTDLRLADSLISRASPGYAASRYLRHPFLHAGPDTATANGLERWLERRDFTVAPVTIDNNEWVYARAYTLALGRNDSAMLGRLVPAYLEHIDQAFAFAESMSVRVVGEEIPQILLLHANELNRDHIRDVLRVIQRRGYRFIPLDQALAHPAYQRRSHYFGPWGISWLLRWSPDSTVWRMDLPAVPDWVEQ